MDDTIVVQSAMKMSLLANRYAILHVASHATVMWFPSIVEKTVRNV